MNKSLRYKIWVIILLPVLFTFSCSKYGNHDNRITITDSADKPDSITISMKIVNDSFESWIAGTRVTINEINNFGLENCFKATDINDSLFEKISACSFHDCKSVKREDLKHIRVIHYDFDGNIRLGELIANKKIADDLVDVFRELYQYNYPVGSIRLIDEFAGDDELSMKANNTSCFNYRQKAGGGKLSKHAYGLAVDINPLYNPYVKQKTGLVLPEEGKPFTKRDSVFPYKIDKNDLAYKAFTKRGFRWGGSWRTVKDYQHFEK